MRATAFLCLVLSMPLLAATCADAAMGIKFNPATGQYEKMPDSPMGAGAGFLSIFFPWATTAASALANVYLAVRNKKWSAAATSTVTGIEEFFATPEGKVAKAKLIEKLQGKHSEAHIEEFIKKLLTTTTAKP